MAKAAANLDTKIAQQRARLEQLEALKKEADRKADTVSKIVIGGTVMAAMVDDEDLRNRVVSLLREKCTRPRDREAVKQWVDTQGG